MAIERAWAMIEADASPVVLTGRNVSSIAQNGTGDYTVTFTNEFVANGTSYVVLASVVGTGASQEQIDAVAVTDGTVRVRTATDGSGVNVNFCLEVISVIV